MSVTPTELWPWLALAGLGLFHGLNPAMGWLFAVALGLHRGSQRVVLLSLVLLWSFLMASGHGAGLMLIPALQPLCSAVQPAKGATYDVPIALAALGVHSAVMLATIAAVSLIVYNWTGVDFLRRGWINVDLIWVAVLATCGVILLVA